MEDENAGEEEEASDDVIMEKADDNEAEAGEEEQEPDAEEMWNKMSDLTSLTIKYCQRDLFEIYFQIKAFSLLQDFCSLQFCKFQEIHKNSQYFQ